MLARSFSETARPAGSSDARWIRYPEASRALDCATGSLRGLERRIAPREMPMDPMRMDMIWPLLEPAQSIPSQRLRRMRVL